MRRLKPRRCAGDGARGKTKRPAPRPQRAVALWLRSAGLAHARAIMKARTSLTEVLEPVLASLARSETDARSICRFCDEGVCRPQGCPVEQAAFQSVEER
ncbi:hypothetical protein GCM10011611_62440 [Aliidongia dinghuensis]|uniref:Uncharacterized protein n=1 Tax=Aliidongia dinghuensis TaxID=1867774 RepID=A0A8J2Z170_9PROT|nr:hypothetical protein GCM10011611_62440 [Aliidongia dinghuensis]